MSLTIELPVEDEARLTARAKAVGVDVQTYIQRVLQVEVTRPSLDEVLRPIHEAFAASGMTEEELGEMLVKAKKQMRADRRK